MYGRLKKFYSQFCSSFLLVRGLRRFFVGTSVKVLLSILTQNYNIASRQKQKV
jgi:hypothetical protein